MVNITTDPVLLRWGPLTLSWHGLWMAAGVVVFYLVVLNEGTRRGFTRQSLSELALWLVIAGAVGARLVHVLRYWRVYRAAPLRILAAHEGGLTVNGAILGVVACAALYARLKRLNPWALGDVLALAAPVALIVGRVGCTINGDAWGLPTDGAWGLVYWHPNASLPPELIGVPTFPIPIVLQVWNVGLFGLLLALDRRAPGDGTLLAVYLMAYAVGRFAVNFWRPGEAVLLGLTFYQVVALEMFLLGTGLLVLRGRRVGRKTSPEMVPGSR
jgi:phosphatidylglycerol:prolipoprotein diacylglycerol transferase